MRLRRAVSAQLGPRGREKMALIVVARTFVVVAATFALSLGSHSTAAEQGDAQPESFPELQERSTKAVNWSEMASQLKEGAVAVDIDGTDVVSVSMTKETKTAGRGLLKLEWDQREVANLKLLQVGQELYLVLSLNGSTSLKAPAGGWHVDNEKVPDFYPGPDVGGVVRGTLGP